MKTRENNTMEFINLKIKTSTTVKNGYEVGSIDTCLYFLYYNYVNNTTLSILSTAIDEQFETTTTFDASNLKASKLT